MKRCTNPNCETSFLFGDDKVNCPFCHSRLADSQTAAGGGGGHRGVMPDAVNINRNNRRTHDFIRETRGTVECRGRITEIEHQELFNSTKHKLFNSLIRGEPYQLGHQTMEYTIRVESITEDYPGEVCDFCMYGNYLGRLHVGDEVIIKAKRAGDRRIVKSIYNATTSTSVNPGIQIPSAFVRGGVAMLALMLVALIVSIVQMFESGAAGAAAVSVLTAFMPLIIICVGVYILFKSIFPGRRRRR